MRTLNVAYFSWIFRGAFASLRRRAYRDETEEDQHELWCMFKWDLNEL